MHNWTGKTTLLDALAGRTKRNKVSGTVYLNGHSDFTFAQRNRLLSYVMQEDSLLGVFTVAESLRFAARFCALVPGSVPVLHKHMKSTTLAPVPTPKKPKDRSCLV